MLARLRVDRLVWATLLLVVASALAASCGGGRTSLRAPPEDCAPAPLESGLPQGLCKSGLECNYAAPRGVGTETFDAVNDLSCSCLDGRWKCESSLIDCAGCAPAHCPFPLVIGSRCVQATNAECLLPKGTPESPTEDLVCACDLPGPVWRCVTRLR